MKLRSAFLSLFTLLFFCSFMTNPQKAHRELPPVLNDYIENAKKDFDAPNPTTNFAAVMTCAHADSTCPIVFGAATKIAIPYEDPKQADGKPNQDEVYNERCKQIATEILYAFSLVKDAK